MLRTSTVIWLGLYSILAHGQWAVETSLTDQDRFVELIRQPQIERIEMLPLGDNSDSDVRNPGAFKFFDLSHGLLNERVNKTIYFLWGYLEKQWTDYQYGARSHSHQFPTPGGLEGHCGWVD